MGKVLTVIFGIPVAIAILIAAIWMGTFNGFQRKETDIIGSERKIASCYQKRADVITNMEATVNRYASHERGTLESVTAQRATVGKITLPDNPTAEQRKEFEAALRANQSALSRLLAVAENYPNLKASTNFLALQTDLRKVENECNLLRVAYIDKVRAYNTSTQTFPSRLVANFHNFTKKPQLQFEDEMQNRKSPRVFNEEKK